MAGAHAVESRRPSPSEAARARRWRAWLVLSLPALLVLSGAARAAAQARAGDSAQGVLMRVVSDGQLVDENADEGEGGEGADGGEEADEAEELPTFESRSIGVPDRGRLREAATLDESEYLFVRRSRRRAHFGTGELVGMVERAARLVGMAHPGPKLVVGDLSRERGGRLHPHRSHRSGRDVDLGFYLTDGDGEPTQPDRFVNVGRRSGCGSVRDERFCFDAERNWALLTALVTDPAARIQYVLVAPYIRRRLLEEGERRGAPPELMERIRTVTEPHRGSRSHRSHFHVRIYCPVDDRPACVDEPPYHDWYVGEPAPPSPAVRRMRARQRRIARRRARIRARRARIRARRRAAARRRARARARRRAAARRRRARQRRRARRRARQRQAAE